MTKIRILVALAHVIVVVLVIIAVTLLAVRHDIPADAVVGLLGAALGTSGTAALSQGAQQRAQDFGYQDGQKHNGNGGEK